MGFLSPMARERKQVVIASCGKKHLPPPPYLSLCQQLKAENWWKLLAASLKSFCDLSGGSHRESWRWAVGSGVLGGWLDPCSCFPSSLCSWQAEAAAPVPCGEQGQAQKLCPESAAPQMCLTSCPPLSAAPDAWSSVKSLDCTTLPTFPQN